MTKRSRMVRVVKRGDTLYIGPDVAIIVQNDNSDEMRLRFIFNRHEPVVCDPGNKPDPIRMDSAAQRLPRKIARGDVFYIGADIVVKVENDPTLAVRLFIQADRSLQIHHAKAEMPEPETQLQAREVRAG